MTSLLFAALAIVGNHLFEEFDLTANEIVILALVRFETFPFRFFSFPENPANDSLVIPAVVFGLVKGWALGFGACHFYRRKLHFENRLKALTWWYCFVSLIGCATVIAMSLPQMKFIPRLIGWCFLLSAGLLIPILVGYGYIRIMRWLLDTARPPTEKE